MNDQNVPTPEEGALAEAIGRELDPRAFDRARFYNDMDYGFYKSRHMYQIDKAVCSNAFREWLAAHDREVAAKALDAVARDLSAPVTTAAGINVRAVPDVILLARAADIRAEVTS